MKFNPFSGVCNKLGNVNVVNEARLLTNLIIKPLQKAAKIMRAYRPTQSISIYQFSHSKHVIHGHKVFLESLE
jgi:hypothetical protein